MFRRAASFAFVLMLSASLPAFASERDSNTPAVPAADAAATAATPAPAAVPLPVWAIDRAAKRPLALTAMYGAYGTLQVMDLLSTRKAIAAGAYEANPLMGSGNTKQMIVMKAATGAVSIYLAEKMWKKNRVGAIMTMAAINGLTATVVAHNTRNARR